MSGPGARRSQLELASEREFLLESLRDLDEERAAGDVSEEDYRTLRASYTERAARTLREIDALGEDRPARDEHGLRAVLGRRTTRRWLAISGTVCVAIGVALAAASFAGVRLPGESATGSVRLPRAQQVSEDLVAAKGYADSGDIPTAIALYSAVLKLEPRQREALTYSGWLERLAGIHAHSAKTVAVGDAAIGRAVRDSPRYADARALDALALDEDRHDLSAALAQARAFLADKKSADYHALLVELGGELSGIFTAAREPVPAALAPYEKAPSKSPR